MQASGTLQNPTPPLIHQKGRGPCLTQKQYAGLSVAQLARQFFKNPVSRQNVSPGGIKLPSLKPNDLLARKFRQRQVDPAIVIHHQG